jgi:hypothetical protein
MWQDTTAAAARQDWQKAQKPVMTVSIQAKIQQQQPGRTDKRHKNLSWQSVLQPRFKPSISQTSPNHYSSNYERWWSKKVQYKGQVTGYNIQCLMPFTWTSTCTKFIMYQFLAEQWHSCMTWLTIYICYQQHLLYITVLITKSWYSEHTNSISHHSEFQHRKILYIKTSLTSSEGNLLRCRK